MPSGRARSEAVLRGADHAALLEWGLDLKHAPLRPPQYNERACGGGARRRKRRGRPSSSIPDLEIGPSLPPSRTLAAPESSCRKSSVERRARREAARQHAVAQNALKHTMCVLERHAEAAAKRVALGKAMRQVVRRETQAEALRLRAVRVKRKQLVRTNRREVKHFLAQRVVLLAEQDAREETARSESARTPAALKAAVQRCRRLRLRPAIRALPPRQWRGRRSGVPAVLGRGGRVLRRGTMGRMPKTRRVVPEPQPRRRYASITSH